MAAVNFALARSKLTLARSPESFYMHLTILSGIGYNRRERARVGIMIVDAREWEGDDFFFVLREAPILHRSFFADRSRFWFMGGNLKG